MDLFGLNSLFLENLSPVFLQSTGVFILTALNYFLLYRYEETMLRAPVLRKGPFKSMGFAFSLLG